MAQKRKKKGKAAGKRKTSGKKKRAWLKIAFLTVSLCLIFLLLCYMTPSEEEAEIRSQGRIKGLEIPFSEKDTTVVSHTGYTLSYAEDYEVPYWVAYPLTREMVSSQAVERNDSFREDKAIPTGSASLSDYRKSGYDRGHMAPAADFRWSEEAMSDTFLLSNMCPQKHSFNAGIWSDIESAVRSIAYTDEEIYVVTGPVLTDGPYETIGENRVAVPRLFYKVILDYRDPEIKAIGFLIPAENSSEPLSYYAVSVDEVEKVTGIDFFPLLPDEIEDTVERSCQPSLWALRPFSLSSESVNRDALMYTSGKTEQKNDRKAILIDLFNRKFYLLKKEVFSALRVKDHMHRYGFI